MINKKILSIIPVAILMCSLLICTNPASAYYGSTYGGLGSMYGGYGGLYGSSYGGYGGLGSMYGGMLGGMYGGLGSMYGGMLGGMYGGLGSMYGGMLGGMYGGLGGLYGGMLGGMYGGLGGLSGMLGTASLLSGLGLTSTPAAAVAAEQTGTWLGTWTTAAGVIGDATLNVVEDPLTGAATGYLVLVFNTFVGAGTTVTGSISNNLVLLGGTVPWNPKPVTLEISGWLITPDHMEGTYQITDYQGGSIKVLEAGILELTLLPSLAVPVPAPVIPLPAPIVPALIPIIDPVLATTPIAVAPPTPILAPVVPPTIFPVIAPSPVTPTSIILDPLATIAGGLFPFFPFFF